MKKLIYIFSCIVLLQSAQTFSQVKKVLFEEFTNASCAPCAANNPFLKAYLESKGDTIVAIKYHTEFPGFDPMYNLNPSQVNERRQGYYSDVNAVPWLKGDGDMFPDIWPFTLANFDNAFNTRKAVIPQVLISVVDTRIAADSISSTVSINIPQNLPAGNYKLRVMAVEKVVEYATPPGNNGERIFEHVFRRGYPDMQGTSVSTSAGNYQFVFKYKIEPGWIDTSIYTAAFVQNDASNKEVLNCAKGNQTTTSISSEPGIIPGEFVLHQNYPNPFNPVTKINFTIPQDARREMQDVKLVVFDALGKKVMTLVNEVLPAGSYELDFDGSSLSSGVYFYKLEAGSFVETKRMTLVK